MVFLLYFGYFFYIKAIENIPVGLAALIESGSLFITLIIDISLGYVRPNILFFILFIVFISSVFVFTEETYKFSHEIKKKKIKLIGIIYIVCSILFYTVLPYIVKLASNYGADEIAINFRI